jgi:hypothetical protein
MLSLIIFEECKLENLRRRYDKTLLWSHDFSSWMAIAIW